MFQRREAGTKDMRALTRLHCIVCVRLLQTLTGRVSCGFVGTVWPAPRSTSTAYEMTPTVHACWSWPMYISAVGITLMI